MISYLRKRTGDPDIWAKIGKRTWSVPFIPYAFSNAVKKESGLRLPQLYTEMAADLQKAWGEEQSSLQVSTFERITNRNTNAYTDYRYPQPLRDNSVLMMKSGIGDIIHFVIVKNGVEKKVFIPGIVNDAGMLSTAGTKVVWSEFGFDPRWRAKSYSLIKMYDVATRQHRTITSKSRYAGASLSPDEKRIVTSESANDYTNALVIIESEFGNVIRKIDNPENAFYSMARWSTDGKKIVSLKTKDGKRSVVSIDAESGVETVLITPSYENIGHPVLHGNYLLYNSPVSGIDNIYVLDIGQQKRLQVTSSKYGAYNPAVDGERILYNEQNANGFDVVSIPLEPTSWREIQIIESEKYDEVLTEQEGRPHLMDSVPQQQFESKKYSKLSGIFNPYSWGAYFNSTFTQADIGISSQDILSTTELKLGYLYDINERVGAWHAGVSYQNWYPIIDVDVTYGKRSLNEGNVPYYEIIPGDTIVATDNLTFDWTEKNLEAGLRLPLITTNSKYHGNFTVGNYIGITKTEDFKNSITGSGRIITPQRPVYWYRDLVDNGKLLYNHFYLSAFRLLKQSQRDINSKWGQTIFLNTYGTPYGGDYTGKQFSFYSTLYFPGFFKHHSIWGYWGYQATQMNLLSRTSSTEEFKDNGSYFFRNQIPLPRGIPVFRFEKFYSMSANYTLPLWYPDLALGPVLNIQRFRGNAFLDYGFGSSFAGEPNAISRSYMSVGGELRMDFNIMRFLQPLNIGVRYSYGIEPSVTDWEVLIGLVGL
jgi:hypothetical protein